MIVKGHRSSMSIQTGNNPGPAAQYRSPGEFMQASRDRMLAPALRDLAQGADQLAGAMHQRDMEKQHLDLINDVNAERSSMQQWIDDYKQTNKGADAFEAEAQFTAYNQERAGILKEKYAGSRRAQTYLAQHMSPLALAGSNAMRDYSNGQMEVYHEQTFQGQQSQLASLIASDPANYERYVGGMITNYENFHRGKGTAPDLVAANSNLIRASGFEEAFNGAVQAGNRSLAADIARRAEAARPAAAGGGGGYSIPSGGTPANIPKGAQPYMGLVNEASREYGVPANIILAVMQTESAFKAGAVSQTGVKGLMQVTQSTYKGLGFTGDRSDPSNSVRAGTKLLGQLYKQYGNWEDAFAAYNGGHHAVTGLRSNKWGTWAGNSAKQREIRNYAPTVMKNVQAMGEVVGEGDQAASEGDQPVMLASLGSGPIGVGALQQQPAAGSDEILDVEFVADPLSEEGEAPAREETAQAEASIYGGLVPRGTLQKMRKTLISMEQEEIKALHQAELNQLDQADMAGKLSHEMVLKSRTLTREQRLNWLKVADGEAGFQGYVKTQSKNTLDNMLYATIGEGGIYNAKDLDRWYQQEIETPDGIVRPIDYFDRKDIERHKKEILTQANESAELVKKFLAVNSTSDSFSSNKDKKALEKEQFKEAALRTISDRRLRPEQDAEAIDAVLGDLLANKKYQNVGPDGLGDELKGKHMDRPGAMDYYALRRVTRAGLPDTPINRDRGREAILQDKAIGEIMPPNAADWGGRGLMNLFSGRGSVNSWNIGDIAGAGAVKSYREYFEAAGQSYNVDPNLLAAMAYVASRGEKYAQSTLRPGGIGVMQISQEDAAGLGLADSLDSASDPRQNILAAARIMGTILDNNGGDVPAALKEYYATGVESEAQKKFMADVLQLYDDQSVSRFAPVRGGADRPLSNVSDYPTSIWIGG